MIDEGDCGAIGGMKLQRANLNHWTSPHLRTERNPVSEMLCFLVYRILDDG
jgi:hypothetical protein